MSWVDATYWAVMRQLSKLGLRAIICIREPNDLSAVSRTVFFRYVKAIAGPSVEIDSTTFTNFLHDVPKTTTQVYSSMGAFAKLAPLIFNCEHTLHYIWDKYGDDVLRTYSVMPSALSLLENEESIESVSVLLSEFETGFLVSPTALDGNSGHPLSPEDTFCFGAHPSDEILRRIRSLSNEALKCIAVRLVAPLLSFWERPAFLCMIAFLLARRGREDLAKDTWTNQVIAQILSHRCCSVHHRIVSANA